MVIHRRYEEEQASSSGAALNAIRERLLAGWQLLSVRGATSGPWVIAFQRDFERTLRNRESDISPHHPVLSDQGRDRL